MSEQISFSGATTFTSSTSGNFISTGVDLSSYITNSANVNPNGAISPAAGSGRPLLLSNLTLGFASGTNSAGAGTFVAVRNSSTNPDRMSYGSDDYYESSSISDLDDSIDRTMSLPCFWTDVLYVGFKKSDSSLTRITAASASTNVVYSYSSSATDGTLASGYAQTSTLTLDEVPGAVSSLSVSGGSSGTLSASWSAPSDNGGSAITGYRVSYSSGGSYTHVNTASTSWSASVPDGTYTVRVAALNGVTDRFNSVYSWTGDTYMTGAASTGSGTVTSTITITFDFQGGSGSPSSKTINVGDAIGTLPSPTQGTYNFVGWYTTVGPTGGSSVSTATTFSSNTTIYARWESTVSFNANGGTSVSAAYVPKGNTLDVTTSSFNSARSGFSFLGWYATTTGGTRYTSFIPTGSITIYANWQGTVTYDEQGGTAVSDVNFVLGNSVSLPSSTRTGYSLSGWYTASSGGSSVGTAGQSYTPSSTLTLYARWAALPVGWSDATLTLTARKGSAYSSTVAANYVNSWNDGILPSKGLSFTQGTSTTGSSTSTLSGTPNDYGDLTFTLTPYNADGVAGDAYTYTISIADVALSWSDQVLASSVATESVSYTDGVSVTSGPTTTYSEKVANSLPPGLSLNSSTGAITGTPTTAGSYDFVIVATNGTGETIETSTLTITVEAAGGYVKVWNGSTWANGIVYVRQSGAWTEATAKVRNSSSGWTDSFSS